MSEIKKSGKATCGLQGPMADRLVYLEKNGLIVADERTMLGMAWGLLGWEPSGNSFAGVGPRIGLFSSRWN